MDVTTRTDEDLLLELLNTTPVVGDRQVDELAEGDDAGAWASARGGTGTPREAAALRRVRDALQGVTNGTAEPDVLAPQLERVSLHPDLHDGTVRWSVAAPDDELLAARALLAWAGISESLPGRLRPCANPECRRFLIDRSRANGARWCSMALCGNRMKARRHHARSRTAP